MKNIRKAIILAVTDRIFCFFRIVSLGTVSYTHLISLCLLTHFDADIIASLVPKSITTPIGIEVSAQLGGIPAISVLTILVTGIFGAVAADVVFRVFQDVYKRQGIAYDDFMELKKEYFDVFAFMDETKRFTSIDKEFMVYDKSTRDSVEFHYYPGMRITLTGSLKHFLPVKEGVYPPPVGAEGGETLMEKMRTMVPRRIQHDFHRYIMYSDYVKKHPEVANDLSLIHI